MDSWVFHNLGYSSLLLYYFVTQIVSSLATGSYFRSCAPLINPHRCGFFFWVLLYFPALQDAPGSFYIFPAPALESRVNHSVRSPDSLYRRMASETKIYVLGMLGATGALLTLVFSLCTVKFNKFWQTHSVTYSLVPFYIFSVSSWGITPYIISGYGQSTLLYESLSLRPPNVSLVKKLNEFC